MVSSKKDRWSFVSWLVFLVLAFITMVKEGVIVPSAYGAIIFAFFVGWDGSKLWKNNK
ncbi:hypothetical protein MITS9509_00702 [Synechococcus sp. MIT S9509]|nr:hypothetical protein MITS9504_00326 [Synechococcus sp. MIT S9504]KZR93407.1 hypothetical protein MITS9509_00702 [Synechococcus sp. MIT S9509]